MIRSPKKNRARWKTKNQTAPLSILCFQEPPEQRALLEQIAKAIDVCFGPAQIVHAEAIEKEKQWEAFFSGDGSENGDRLRLHSVATEQPDAISIKKPQPKECALLEETPLFLTARSLALSQRSPSQTLFVEGPVSEVFVEVLLDQNLAKPLDYAVPEEFGSASRSGDAGRSAAQIDPKKRDDRKN